MHLKVEESLWSVMIEVINTVKDIVVDDVKYKFQGMVDSDPHEIEDIVVDEIVNSEDVISIQKRVEEAQWVYAEVGKELRLCSRDFPYVGSTNDATCTELNTYLHFVDEFVNLPQKIFSAVTVTTTTIVLN
ncbi:hypothetical protein AHAS_Ahas05G0070100 [Arachis hypogaea]